MKQEVLPIEALDIKLNSFTVIGSRRNSGKTFLLRNLIYHILNTHEINSIVLFSKTAKFSGEYSFIDKQNIFDFDTLETNLQKIMKYQEKKIKSKDKHSNVLVVLDDCDLSVRSKMLQLCATLGRHLGITIICSVQYCKTLLNSAIRNNLDYTFFSSLNYESMDAIYKCIVSNLRYSEFETFTDANNNDFKFILYDSYKPKKLFVVKARELKDLKLT